MGFFGVISGSTPPFRFVDHGLIADNGGLRITQLSSRGFEEVLKDFRALGVHAPFFHRVVWLPGNLSGLVDFPCQHHCALYVSLRYCSGVLLICTVPACKIGERLLSLDGGLAPEFSFPSCFLSWLLLLTQWVAKYHDTLLTLALANLLAVNPKLGF